MGLTNYGENLILDATLRGQTLQGVTPHLALFTTNPGETGVGTEVSGGGYVRKQVTFGAPTDGSVSNSVDIVFPEATGNWGSIGYFGLMDASTGGNMIYYGQLDIFKVIETNDILQIKAGGLTVSLD